MKPQKPSFLAFNDREILSTVQVSDHVSVQVTDQVKAPQKYQKASQS